VEAGRFQILRQMVDIDQWVLEKARRHVVPWGGKAGRNYGSSLADRGVRWRIAGLPRHTAGAPRQATPIRSQAANKLTLLLRQRYRQTDR
jgi:hypothetical protein